MPFWFSWKRRRKLNPAELRAMTMQFADTVAPRTALSGHLISVGGTGGGKTTALRILLKSVLKHKPKHIKVSNAFISDPLNDIYPGLVAMNLPQKIIATNVFAEGSQAWDMCADITDSIAAFQAAHTLMPENASSTQNKFYEDCPRIIVGGVMRGFIDRKVKWTPRLLYLVSLNSKYAEELFRNSKDPGVQSIVRLFNQDQGQTKANIEASLLTKLAPLEPFAALSEHCKKKYSIKDAIKSDVVMVAGGDPSCPDVIDPINYTLLSVTKKMLIGQEESTERQTIVAVDEASELNGKKPADELIAFLERGRGRGVRTILAIQTPEQLVKVYGKETMNIITGLCKNKLIFKLDDLEACKWASEVLGNDYGHEWNGTVNIGGSSTPGQAGSTSWGRGANESYFDRPRVHPSEIRNLPPGNFKTGIHGFAVLAGSRGVDRWRFLLGPEFLTENAVQNCPTAASYQSSRRPAWQMKLEPLTPEEAKGLGLTYDGPIP